MTNTPKNLYFTTDHEWVLVLEDNLARVGITQYATEQLGDIVFVEVPELDSAVSVGEEMATVESVKSASEIFVPVTGMITKVNDELEDSPELVNESPYEKGWLAEIQFEDAGELTQLMNQEAYEAYAKELKEEEG